MARIGIFGGSFNPVHVGHVSLARQLLSLARLDEVRFVVSPLNPFKQQAGDLMPDALRLAMVQRALANEPGLEASDVEFGLPRPSYMWNTLQHLSALLPGQDLVLVIGADNWLAFDRWAHSRDILSHYELAVYPRPGYAVDAVSLPPQVHLYDVPLFPVSSTDIRRRMRRGLPVDHLVPPGVADMLRRWLAEH